MGTFFEGHQGLSGMLQHHHQRQEKRKTTIQLAWQPKAPNLQQIKELLAQAQSNLGCPVEMSFGTDPTKHVLTVLLHNRDDEGQWMFYKVDVSGSKLEWSYKTSDIHLIHGAMCANFPEVDLPASDAKLTNISFSHFDEETPEDKKTNRAAAPQAAAQKSSNAPLMEGQLQHLQLANLIQSISLSQMTGRLEFDNENEKAQLYFTNGNAVHATVLGIVGEEAILEIVGWTAGNYRFYHEPPGQLTTVRRRLDLLLLEGTTLLDQWNHMQQLGVCLDSVIVRKHQSMSEQAFEQIVGSPPCDIGLLKSIYQAIDGRSSLAELVRRLGITRREWVPAMCTLATCQLIEGREAMVLSSPASIDWEQVRQCERNLVRQDTGLFSYYAFLAFLEREHIRFENVNRPYALVILEFLTRSGGQLEPISLRGLREIAARIERVKRRCDIIGHFETFGVGILLPETNAASAWQLIRIISETCDTEKRLAINAGVASAPQDGYQLEALLACANPRHRPRNI